MNYIDFYFDNIDIEIDNSKELSFRKNGGGSIGGEINDEGVCCFIRNQFIQIETISNNSLGMSLTKDFKDVHYDLYQNNKSYFKSLDKFINSHIDYLDYVASAPSFITYILNEETGELESKSMQVATYPYDKQSFTDTTKENITYLYSFGDNSMIRFGRIEFSEKCAKARNLKIENILNEKESD